MLDFLNDFSLRATTKATVKGLLKQSGKASILFGIKIAGDIFGVCEPVARSLQRPGTTAGDCLKLIEKLKNSLSKMRSEKVFEKYFDEVSSSDLVKMPNISRSKNTSLRFRHTTTTEEVALSVTDDWRRQFFPIVAVIENELTRRFQQQGIRVCSEQEELLLSAVKCGVFNFENAPASTCFF